MPAEFELMRETRTVYSRGSGALTDADLLDHMMRIAALFRTGVLESDWAQILDFSAVDHVDGVSTAGIRRMAEQNPWPRYAVRACIVATDEQFGLLRMYQALGDPKTDDLCITRSAAEADAFIARERVRLGIAI